SSGTEISFDITARLDELPGLMVSLMAFLVVLSLEGLGMRRVIGRGDHQRIRGVSVLSALAIGFVAILGTFAVSYQAYEHSRDAIRKTVADANLALGRTVCNVAFEELPESEAVDRESVLERISDKWSRTVVPYDDAYLCVIGPEGKLDLHTAKPQMQGTDVSNIVVSEENSQTVLQLLKSHESWSGRNINARGISQLVGYHYESMLDSLVAVHIPVTTVDAGFRAAVIPWIGGIVLIGGILMPLSLGMLFHHSRQAHAEAVASLTALRESEEKFRVLTEKSPAIVLIARAEKIVYCNSMLTAITGYSSDELLGMHVQGIVHPDYRDLVVGRHRRRIKGEPVPTHYEIKIVTKSGRERWVDFSAQLIEFEGEPAVLAASVDVNDRKLAEEQLHQKESQLAHVSRLSMMGEMVAGIAHEINQPLSAIANYALATKNSIETSGNCDANVLGWLERINEQAVSCGEIIQRLRNFVKKGDDKKWTDLNDIVRDSLALLECEIRHISVFVDSRLPDTETLVFGNPLELQQVVVNLLQNACDAVKDEANAKISISVHKHGNTVQLIVADNGPGIDPLCVNKVFDAFFTTKSNGMGIGLAISKSIIEDHGGRLAFDPEATTGTSFHIDLPAADITTGGTHNVA
ncbi:MAG: PAS domain S-box protein, partial [Planctomycetales bacterium]|nr:PAS domain S-box protein [Planctomycetales bacterium]